METIIKAKVLSDGESVDYDVIVQQSWQSERTVYEDKLTFNCENKQHANRLKAQLDKLLADIDIFSQEHST